MLYFKFDYLFQGPNTVQLAVSATNKMMDLVADKSVEGQEPLVIHEPDTGVVAFMEKSDVKSLGTGYE